MMKYNQRVVALVSLWSLICALHADASTRQKLFSPFSRPSERWSDDANKNKTVMTDESLKEEPEKDEVSGTVKDEDGKEPPRRRHPLSDWFASMNQRSITKEEELKKEHDDSSESTHETNKTSSDWPQGGYWPTSSSLKGKARGDEVGAEHDKSKETEEVDGTKEDPMTTTDPVEQVDSDPVSPIFQSPSFNLFRGLRENLRPKQIRTDQGAKSSDEQTQGTNYDQSTPPSQTDDNKTPQRRVNRNITETDMEVERASDGHSLLSRIQDSASSATTLLRQSPWQRPQQQKEELHKDDTVTTTDHADAMCKPNMTKTAIIVVDGGPEQIKPTVQDYAALQTSNESQTLERRLDIERNTLHSGVMPILVRLKESAANTTAFARQKMQAGGERRRHESKRVNATIRSGYSNPISIIRDLPWTSEGGKKYSENTASSPPEKINLLQFIRGLPWTPRRESREEEVFKSSNSDEGQIERSLGDDMSMNGSSLIPTDKVNREGGAQVETRLDDYDETVGLAEGSPDDTFQTQKPNDEGEVHAVEVDDVLSKYLLRQEVELESSNEEDESRLQEDDGPKHKQPPTEEESRVSIAVTDKMGEWSARQNDANATNLEVIKIKEPRDTARMSSLSLNSLFRRVIGSIKEQEKSIEAKEKSNRDEADDSSLSNVTSTETPKQPDEASPVSNRTQTPASEDQTSFNEERDQRYGQQPLQQQQPPTVIIVGGGPQDGKPLPDLARRPVPTPSLVLVEALVTIIGTAFRIWMVSFLAKWWSEEEILRPVQHFVWERVNDRYLRDSSVLQNVLQLPPTGVAEWKWRRFLHRHHRIEGKVATKTALASPTFARTVVVFNIDSAMNIPHLEQTVTFILSQHREQAFGSIGGLAKELEVILLVDSPGGAISDYGLAGAQIRRLTEEAGVTTTVCVDQIAASGGYLIASQADRIFASTFAIVGSIGVIREGFNIHEALERHGIKGLVLKAGDSKVPLTLLGQVTKSDISKAQRTLDLMHHAFKEFVVQGRPALEECIEDVANGDIYFGNEAMELSLIDRIVTSEEYILERVQAGDRVMKLHRAHQFAARRRQLFHPLDFLREKGSPLRSAWTKCVPSNVRAILSRAIAATSAAGAYHVLTHQKFYFGGR